MNSPAPDKKLLSFDEEGRQFAWDSTSLGNYSKCPRYYYYTNLEGYQPKQQSPHLFFGGVYASALEHFHKLRAEGVEYDAAMMAVVKEAMISTWEYDLDEDGNEIMGTGQPWESLHNTKTRETLIRTIVWYLEHFRDDPASTVILDDGSAAVEYSFALPLHDEIIICGHIDRLVEYGGDIYVMDQKTTGSAIGGYFFTSFTPDIQMSCYTYAGKIIFNLPIKGVIIDAAQIMVGFTRYARGFATRSDFQLEEWMDTALSLIERARKDTQENHFPMNTQSCGNYGGCTFREVCSSSKDHRKRLLNSNFSVQDRWDPLKRR